jgi:hypothetical protein
MGCQGSEAEILPSRTSLPVGETMNQESEEDNLSRRTRFHQIEVHMSMPQTEGPFTIIDGIFTLNDRNILHIIVPKEAKSLFEDLSFDPRKKRSLSKTKNGFTHCRRLKSCTLPCMLNSLPKRCFMNCRSLTSFTVPIHVTTLPKTCFNGCWSLSSLTFHEEILEIGVGCFYGCSSLTSFTVPIHVTTLPEECFYGCSYLSSLTLHKGIREIGVRCFSRCRSLRRIFLPRSIITVSDDAFTVSCTQITFASPATHLARRDSDFVMFWDIGEND